jgi:hypothetical protein
MWIAWFQSFGFFKCSLSPLQFGVLCYLLSASTSEVGLCTLDSI